VRNKPALKFSLALTFGILAQHFFDFKFETLALLSLLLLAVYFIFTLLKIELLKFLSIYSLVLIVGALKYTSDTKFQPKDSIVNFTDDTAIVKIQGKLISLPEVKNGRTNLVISTSKVFKQNKVIDVSGDVFVSIRKGKSPFDSLPKIGYGDEIQIIGILKEPIKSRNPEEFDFAKYLKINDIDTVLLSYMFSHIKITQRFNFDILSPLEFLQRITFTVRSYGLQIFDKLLPLEEASFVKGLVLGYRGEISKDVQQYFINTGTYHILAVSGLHVGIITSMFFALTGFLKVNLTFRVLLTIFGLIFYAFTVGLPPSVVRATLMASIFLLGMAIERRVDIFNLLGFSAIIILLFDSKQIFHPGFQLSFSAVASLVYFYPKIFKFPFQSFSVRRSKIHPSGCDTTCGLDECTNFNIALYNFILQQNFHYLNRCKCFHCPSRWTCCTTWFRGAFILPSIKFRCPDIC